MPITPKDLPMLFSVVGLSVSENYSDAIMDNLHILQNYTAMIDSFPLPDHEEPAAQYEPHQP